MVTIVAAVNDNMMDELTSAISPVLEDINDGILAHSILIWMRICIVLNKKEIAPILFIICIPLGALKIAYPWLSVPKGMLDMVRIVSAGITGQLGLMC